MSMSFSRKLWMFEDNERSLKEDAVLALSGVIRSAGGGEGGDDFDD